MTTPHMISKARQGRRIAICGICEQEHRGMGILRMNDPNGSMLLHQPVCRACCNKMYDNDALFKTLKQLIKI